MPSKSIKWVVLAAILLAVLLLLWYVSVDKQEAMLSAVRSGGIAALYKYRVDQAKTVGGVQLEEEDFGDFVPAPVNPKLLDEVRGWWKAPIVLYGKVVDENDAPISDAKVDILVNDSSRTGTTKYLMKSDPSGMFQVTGLRGKHLHVDISKKGYYQSEESFRSYQYAGPGEQFVPNKDKPEIFRLHKKGEPAMLVNQYRQIPLELKTGVVNINLLNLLSRKISDENLGLEVIPPGPLEPLWTYRLTVEGGGIQERVDPFLFLAPSDGYLQTIDIKFETIENKDFFLKFRNGNYARISIRLLPGNAYTRVQSYLNPEGSRNLEYDECYVIRVRHTEEGTKLIYSDPEELKRELGYSEAE